MMLAGGQKNQRNQQRCKEEASGGQEISGGLRRGAGRGQECRRREAYNKA
jgi:hypothetical protein